jgi:hypothetical protein
MICPTCGLPYVEDELSHITGPESKFRNNKGKMLLQADKKKKKLRAEDGSEICPDDEVIKMDLAQGRRVLSYHEYKVEKK